MEFEEADKIIITYLIEGFGQKEMGAFLRQKGISPNSQSAIEKRIKIIKLALGAKTYFQLGLIIAKMDKNLFVPDTKIEFPLSGSLCPKFEKEMVVKARMFFWRGKYFNGLVCIECNSLYDNPNDSFEKHIGIKK